MQVNSSIALVTGANRGIGRAFVEALLERCASQYAAARELASLDCVVSLDPNRIRALKLDVTSADDARAAAAQARDVMLLINNVGCCRSEDPPRFPWMRCEATWRRTSSACSTPPPPSCPASSGAGDQRKHRDAPLPAQHTRRRC